MDTKKFRGLLVSYFSVGVGGLHPQWEAGQANRRKYIAGLHIIKNA